MKKRILMICLTAVLIFLWSCATQPEQKNITSIYTYDIILPDQPETGNLDVNTYTAVHLLYTDFFYRLGLMDALSVEDKTEIIAAMLGHVSFRYPVNVVIHDYFPEGDLRTGIRLGQENGPPYALFLTNMDLQTGKMIGENESFSGAYASLYYIVNGKMVQKNNLYDPDLERQYTDEEIPNNLADLYLFDERPDNDRLIEGYLNEGIHSSEPFSRAIAHATWAQYCLSMSDFNGAADHLAEVSALQKRVTDEQSMNLQEILNIIDDEIYIMKHLP